MSSRCETPPQKAERKRDRALARYARAMAEAEKAFQAWLKYSARVAKLACFPEADVAPEPANSHDTRPFICPDPMRGLLAEVAERLALSHEHVRQVAYGKRVSARVTDALEAAKKEREQKKEAA